MQTISPTTAVEVTEGWRQGPHPRGRLNSSIQEVTATQKASTGQIETVHGGNPPRIYLLTTKIMRFNEALAPGDTGGSLKSREGTRSVGIVGDGAPCFRSLTRPGHRNPGCIGLNRRPQAQN